MSGVSISGGLNRVVFLFNIRGFSQSGAFLSNSEDPIVRFS